MANIITGIRVLASIALLFCPAFTPVFYFCYLAAGVSDIADGAVARKTNTVSEFGSRLDTAADLIFAAICCIKLLPLLCMPTWVYYCVTIIAMIKIGNILSGYIRHKKLTAVHSVINKAAGGLCFLLPFTVSFIDIRYSAAVICMVAAAAAIHESCIVYKQT
ncbi:CDP-alcohol phosphatidyltransferase family protein [Ruminococcus flavefaciens]|uniref:CDP-alcohol phosphatidyltransferase n=1 Tax=Ruminococcus flavefaciens 007c TaxID=1341157 RepID=W7UQ05_RUMFL|nr:CDP-alcohol phosphatidyltransferase family protein [Ruminococcus flavefaciens]EWM53559.1 hypothetical protein RF007C_07705 [Ruminococcus flavefaciens 007c]